MKRPSAEDIAEKKRVAVQKAEAARFAAEKLRDAPRVAKVKNPLDDLEYTGNVEVDSANEAEVIRLAVEERKQRDSIELANDTEFWFSVYFQTREQKEVFLAALDLLAHADKYLDGQFVAKKLGISLPPRPAPYKVGRVVKSLDSMT